MSPKDGRRFWIGFAISLLLMEVGYRAYLYQQYVVDVLFKVTTQDNPPRFVYLGTPNAFHGNYEPGINTRTSYNIAGERFARVRIAINSLGWRSRYDYAVEKKPGEYRIAVIGDSLTASVTNEQAWPDLLQQELNSDTALLPTLNATSVTVFNISTAGANFSMLANTLTDISKRLDADHLVVNFPIGSLPRRGGVLEPSSSRSWNAGPETPSPVGAPGIELDGGVKVSLTGCDDPRTLANPACRLNPVWIVPKGVELSTDEVNRLKHDLAFRIIWARVIATVKPLLLYEIAGRPIIPRTDAQAAGRAADDVAGDIAYAVDAFSTIRQIYPDAQIVHVPTYSYLHPTTNRHRDRLELLADAARERSIDIIDAAEYVPLHGGKDDWYRWYNLPRDGHFSDYGAAIYARAVHKVIAEQFGSHLTD